MQPEDIKRVIVHAVALGKLIRFTHNGVVLCGRPVLKRGYTHYFDLDIDNGHRYLWDIPFGEVVHLRFV